MAELTQVPDPDVLRRWRSGPRWWSVVAAMIDDPRVEERRRAVAAALADLVQVTNPGQAHVTLWVGGFDASPRLPDQRTVSLTVGVPDTFSSAVYLAVGGAWAAARDGLVAVNGPDRDIPFVPHVTVGTYHQEVPLTTIQDRLAQFAGWDDLVVTAHMEHVVVDTRSTVGALAPAERRMRDSNPRGR
ncbi:MAG: hypothetical protein U0R64_01090 [Candidatus Nanopelagicales bacterium]